MELIECADIIATKADRGGAAVIMNVEESEQQLKNQEHYKKQGEDSTEINSKLKNDTMPCVKKARWLKDIVTDG